MVDVGVSVERTDEGVRVGAGNGPEQEARINPHAARRRVQFHFNKVVSFIRSKF